MAYFQEKMNQSGEIISAIFIIALVSFFILVNFAVGFVGPLFLVVMAIAFLIALFYPRSGLYAIIFLTFIFERFFTLAPIIIGRNEYKLYPLDIILAGILAGIVFQKILSSRKSSISLKNKGENLPWLFSLKKGDNVEFYLAGFIGIVMIYFLTSVIVWGGDFSLAFSSLKNYGFYPLLYFAVIFLLNKKRYLMRFLKFALAGAAGIIVFIFIGIVRGEGLWSEYTPLSTEGVRILAFPHGFYLSMALLFSLAWIVFQKNNFSRLLLFLTPIWLIGVIGSMMRHLWIAVFISLVFMFFAIPPKNKKNFKKVLARYGWLAIIFLISVFYLAVIFPQSNLNQDIVGTGEIVQQRIMSITDTRDESISWRGVVWKEALKNYWENAIFGLGFGKKIFVEIGEYAEAVEARNIHNSFLALFVQMSIWGLGIVSLFVVSLCRRVWKKTRESEASFILIASFSVLILHLTVFMFQPYLETNLLGMFFWINLGIMKARMKQKD